MNPWFWLIDSESSAEIYSITRITDPSKGKTRWFCTCPHFIIRLKGRTACKHIDLCKAEDQPSLESMIRDLLMPEEVRAMSAEISDIFLGDML